MMNKMSMLLCFCAAGCATHSKEPGDSPATVAIVADGRAWADAKCPGSFGWADALPAFFKRDITVSKFTPDKLADALATKPDFLLVATGQGDADAKTSPQEFSERLANISTSCHAQKTTPVFVTPPMLRTIDPVSAKPITNAPADAQRYADAMIACAKAENIALIDLRGAMQATYKEIGERSNWFLHPPMDITKEPASNIRTNKQWRSPTRRNPAYFSETGAESLAHWIANLLRAGDCPLRNFLRDPDGPPSPDYKLVWSDEFDGTDWTKNWSCRSPGKRKDGFNDPACIRLDGEGHLVIDVKQETNGVHAALASTDGKHEWKYGYFESRCTIADDDGYWSAFWMMSNHVGDPMNKRGRVDDTANNGTEIDIFECMKVQGDVVHQNLHWNGYGDDHKSSPFDTFVPDLRKQKWHVYAVDWRPDGYTFYVDGRRAWETHDAISQTPEYIILSIEIGKWAGDVSKAKLPQKVMFDWVRVWQKSG